MAKITAGTTVSSTSEGMYSKEVTEINVVSKTDNKGIILTVKDHPSKPKTSLKALKFWAEVYIQLKEAGYYE